MTDNRFHMDCVVCGDGTRVWLDPDDGHGQATAVELIKNLQKSLSEIRDITMWAGEFHVDCCCMGRIGRIAELSMAALRGLRS